MPKTIIDMDSEIHSPAFRPYVVVRAAGAQEGVAVLFARALSDGRDVQSYTTFAIFGLTLAVTGGAMFLRYGLAKFLRLWLLRQMYEGQSHIDQVVEALKK